MLDGNQELLKRVTLGELDAEAEEVLAARRADPEFDRAMRETELILAGLDNLKSSEDAILADAAERTEAPGEKLVAGFVAERVGRPKGLPRWLLAAAALILICSVWWASTTPSGEVHPIDPILGETDLELIAPLGNWGPLAGPDAVKRFEWRGELRDGKFRVVVYDLKSGEVALESLLLEELSWSLSPAEADLLPEEFEWEVRWYDPTGIWSDTEGPVLVSP